LRVRHVPFISRLGSPPRKNVDKELCREKDKVAGVDVTLEDRVSRVAHVVFVSIGVSYYFVHQYAVPLDCDERDWLDRSEWLGVIRGKASLRGAAAGGSRRRTAMISYLTITAAVRKYKKYSTPVTTTRTSSPLSRKSRIRGQERIERIKNHPSSNAFSWA